MGDCRYKIKKKIAHAEDGIQWGRREVVLSKDR